MGVKNSLTRQLIQSFKVCYYIDGKLLSTAGKLSILHIKSSSQLIARSGLDSTLGVAGI